MSANQTYSEHEIEQKRLLALRRKELAKRVSGNAEAQENCNSKGSGNESAKNLQSPSNCDKNKPRNSFVMLSQSLQANRYNPLKSKDSNNSAAKQPPVHAKCSMITENRFCVDISGFQQQAIDAFKSMPSRSYDLKTKIWNFHITDYDDLIKKLSPLKPRVILEPIPNRILQIFKKQTNTDNTSIDLSTIDKKLETSLLPFQQEGVRFGISKNGRCIIADDMGLGKTIQALGIAHYYMSDWPLLIVTPSSVRYQWSEAIYNFLPSVPTQYIHHFVNAKDVVGDAKVVILSYDILKRAITTIERYLFGTIIFDESHFLKTLTSQRTSAAERVAAQAKRIILLSGTPALSRPMELYSQINLVVPKFLGHHEFGVRYCAAALGNYGWEYGGSSNMQELQSLLKHCCLIRRLKSEVLTQLPSKIREVVFLDPKLVKTGSKEMKNLSSRLKEENLHGQEENTVLLGYYRETAKAKIKAVRNYVTDLVESGTKFLIFAHHRVVLDEICDVLDSKNVGYIRIDGSTKSEQRKVQCDTFQQSDDCLVAVLSITAANTGLTLTAAQRVIFAELYWNPGVMCQAEDRVHRIGQAGSVLIQFLVARNTADDRLWPLIQGKLETLGKAGLGQNFSLNKAAESKQVDKSKQTTLYSYLDQKISQSSSNCEIGNEEEDLHNLLKDDDEDLSLLDLDLLESSQ